MYEVLHALGALPRASLIEELHRLLAMQRRRLTQSAIVSEGEDANHKARL